MARFTAMDIANLFVQISHDLHETEITNMKLNKLCYYAQGWSLARLGYPLFDDAVQAWKFGPVIPAVYRAYKVCGKTPIAEAYDDFDESRLSTDELNLLVDVFTTYGKYTANQLMLMTHADGTPWSGVFREGENAEITQEAMTDYFSRSDELETMQLNITPENVKTYA